jgi:hypothetical protein
MEAMRWTVAAEADEATEPAEPVVGAVEETEADALEEFAPAAPEEPDALPGSAVVTGPRGDEFTCTPSRWF